MIDISLCLNRGSRQGLSNHDLTFEFDCFLFLIKLLWSLSGVECTACSMDSLQKYCFWCLSDFLNGLILSLVYYDRFIFFTWEPPNRPSSPSSPALPQKRSSRRLLAATGADLICRFQQGISKRYPISLKYHSFHPHILMPGINGSFIWSHQSISCHHTHHPCVSPFQLLFKAPLI